MKRRSDPVGPRGLVSDDAVDVDERVAPTCAARSAVWRPSRISTCPYTTADRRTLSRHRRVVSSWPRTGATLEPSLRCGRSTSWRGAAAHGSPSSGWAASAPPPVSRGPVALKPVAAHAISRSIAQAAAIPELTGHVPGVDVHRAIRSVTARSSKLVSPGAAKRRLLAHGACRATIDHEPLRRPCPAPAGNRKVDVEHRAGRRGARRPARRSRSGCLPMSLPTGSCARFCETPNDWRAGWDRARPWRDIGMIGCTAHPSTGH